MRNIGQSDHCILYEGFWSTFHGKISVIMDFKSIMHF